MACFGRVLYYCLLFLTTVVGTQSVYPAQLSSACKNADITIDCGAGEQIHVIGAYYGTGSGGSHCDWTPADCLQSVEADVYLTIRDSCQGNSTCTVEKGMAAVEPRCGKGQTDYQVIEYRCIPVIDTVPPGNANITHSCDRDLNVTCFGDTVIDVSAAYYMDIGGLTTDCTRRSLHNDCRSPVEPSYLEEIKDKCNQNQACDDLDQRTASNTSCSPGGWNVGTEYVAIVYRCVNDTDSGSTVSSTDVTSINPPRTSEDSITSTDTSITATTGSDESSGASGKPSDGMRTSSVPVSAAHTTQAPVVTGSSLTTEAVIGIAAAAALIVIIIIVVTVFVIRKRKKDSQTEKRVKSSTFNSNIYRDEDIVTGEKRPVPSAPGETLVRADPEYSVAQSVPGSCNNASTPVPKYEMVDDCCVGITQVNAGVNASGYEMVNDFGTQQSEDGTVAPDSIPTGNSPNIAPYSKVTKPVKSDDTVLIDNTEYTPWEEDGNAVNGETMVTDKQCGSSDKVSVDETGTVFVDNENYAGWNEAKISTAKADTVIVDNQSYAEWDDTQKPQPKSDTVLVDNQNYAEWDETKEPKPKGDTVLVDNQNYAVWDDTQIPKPKGDTVLVDNQNYAEWDDTQKPKPKSDTILVDNQNYAEWDDTQEPKPKGDTVFVDNQNYAEWDDTQKPKTQG